MRNTLSRKAKLFILSVLMPLSMMSIGFSSWTITSVHNLTGSITTETVTDKGTYITACEVEYFEYMSTGFFTRKEDATGNYTVEIRDTGYITTTLTIDLDKCRDSDIFNAGDNLQLQVELFNDKTVVDSSGETLSLFPYFTTATYAESNSNAATVKSRSVDTTKATAAFTFILDETTQSVTYTIRFEFNANGEFDKVYDILQEMKANDVSMVVQAAITEVTE